MAPFAEKLPMKLSSKLNIVQTWLDKVHNQMFFSSFKCVGHCNFCVTNASTSVSNGNDLNLEYNCGRMVYSIALSKGIHAT